MTRTELFLFLIFAFTKKYWDFSDTDKCANTHICLQMQLGMQIFLVRIYTHLDSECSQISLHIYRSQQVFRFPAL